MCCPECEMVWLKEASSCFRHFRLRNLTFKTLDFEPRPVKPPQSLRRDCRFAGTSVQCPSEEIKTQKCHCCLHNNDRYIRFA